MEAQQVGISGSVPPRGRTNGLAIASLVLSLLGGSLLGLIFGFVALSQIRSRPGEQGRGLAIAGIVISSLWLVLVLVIGAVAIGAAVFEASDSESPTATEVDPEYQDGDPGLAIAGMLVPLAEGADSAVGTPAPVLEGHAFDGGTVSVGGPGEPTIVAFLPHWDPHSQAAVQRLVDWREDGTIPGDVRLVAIPTAIEPTRPEYPPQAWLDSVGWTGEVLVDSPEGGAAAAYGTVGYPFFVGVGGDGSVTARAVGELDQGQIEALVESADGTS